MGGMRTSLSEKAEGYERNMKKLKLYQQKEHTKISKQITGKSGEPLTQTDSANRTRMGLALSLCFFAGDSSVDFLPFVQ